MEKKYFKGKRILITGVSGFVGSRLAEKLMSIGAEIYGLSRSETKDNYLGKSILDFEALDCFIKHNGIQIVYHLAGEALVESGQNDPYNTFKVNTEGTLNVLESCRKNAVEKVIIASTTHVYGKNKTPYLEEYTPEPTRPYETSKACADLMAQSYAKTFNLPILIPRFANIYGPGDLNFTRLIPRTIKSVLSVQRPKMWGGEVEREYLFIDDAIDAYLKLATLDLSSIKENRIFNFGSKKRVSVEDLINKIINISKIDLVVERVQEERSQEIVSQYISSQKAQRVLNWKALTNLDEGLKKTISWYREYFKNYHE